MEINKVKELVSAFKEAGLTKLSLKCDEFELKLKKETTGAGTSRMDEDQAKESKTEQEDKKVKESVVSSEKENTTNESKGCLCSCSNEDVQAVEEETFKEEAKPAAGKIIQAPMVGTFYSASAPGAEPFVKVGDQVKKGDVVCVIEAMKLMNEVEAEEDGEIVEILVQNEDMIEYGQPLFVVR